MIGSEYLKLQNQGSIISNIRLLHEMDLAKDYADSQGYYTKRSVAEIGVNSLIITSGSKVGEEAQEIINAEGDESRNSPLQNAKARMQILRVLGLVSTDYGSEIYAITKLGKLMISQVLSNTPNYGLLRELFMTITTSTETYDHNCSIDFNCYIGYNICVALANLDYRLSSEEMPMLTTYDIRDIQSFIEDAKKNRERHVKFDYGHPHYPKTLKGKPLRQASNLTRSINQILRVCEIIKSKQEKIEGINYYVCTDEGKEYVDSINQRFSSYEFVRAWEFRKVNNIAEQKRICIDSFNALLRRSGIDATIERDTKCVFSPYQMLPETTVEWLFGNTIRKHPDQQNDRINVINSQLTTRDLRLNAVFTDTVNADVIDSPATTAIRNEVILAHQQGDSIESMVEKLCEEYKNTEKELFYPFVHNLLNIIGVNCKGEVARYDAYCEYNGHIIPIEIKSFTETPTYNVKGIRQAIENKITTYNGDVLNDIEYASFVIGYDHPTSDAEIRTMIDQAYNIYQIKIVVSDLKTLVMVAARVILENKAIDFEKLLTGYGILMS